MIWLILLVIAMELGTWVLVMRFTVITIKGLAQVGERLKKLEEEWEKLNG